MKLGRPKVRLNYYFKASMEDAEFNKDIKSESWGEILNTQEILNI